MYKNSTNIPISMAVWLATDTYDHDPNPDAISVTSLLKPLKAVVLERTLPIGGDIDIADLIQAKTGTAVHDGIEHAWKANYQPAMVALGHPKAVIRRVVINPQVVLEDDIAVYIEIRTKKDIAGFTLGGKFDFVMEGQLEDFKTTGTYNYINQGNTESYIWQGSMYRWLNPDIITNDHMKITYLFTDWSAIKARADKKYPPNRIMSQTFQLKSRAETETFILDRLSAIKAYTGLSQSLMSECTKEELWQSDSVYKYYKDPLKTARSTKNFDNLADANARLFTDGSVGKVLEVKGEVKRCRYCNANAVCLQAENLQAAGLLTL